MSTRVNGLAAAPGIGIGTIVLYRSVYGAAQHPAATSQAGPDPGLQGTEIASQTPGQISGQRSGQNSPETEWAAFAAASARLDAELARQAENDNTLVAELFAAHRAILHDRTLVGEIRQGIFEAGESALAATHRVVHELTTLFHSFDDDYFAGRAVDILDLGRRLMSHLGAANVGEQLRQLPPDTILLAYDLAPSELAMLPLEQIQGIGVAYSTPTAHSAILAHSLGIPMVSTLGPRILHFSAGTPAVLDGIGGLLLVDPSAAELADYSQRSAGLDAAQQSARRAAGTVAFTQDGVYIPVLANANRPEDVAQAAVSGADGIGLLRTEYLFLGRTAPPTIEEQAGVYADFARQVCGPFVVRALDAGGDKPVSYVDHEPEENPFLGLRGIRLLLEKPHLLQNQYRALQRARRLLAQDAAASTVDFRFLLPMISAVEEIDAVRALLRNESVHDESAHDEAASAPLPLGVMIEVPSAALIAHALAARVDFLSIGTNDLAQYTLASDRTNSAVARLADPLHPAVLQLIAQTCRAAQAHAKPVAVCGEIAGDPLATPLLLGLGVTELSAPVPDIALIKATVRRQTLDACRQLAQAALACATAGEVRSLLIEFQA